MLGAGALVSATAARHLLAQPPAPGLVIRNERPLDAEAPLGARAPFETPNDASCVRSHFGAPAATPPPYRLEVTGDGLAPRTLSLRELRRLGEERRAITLERAGNGRGAFELAKT